MIMFVRAISICTLLVLANAALAQTGYPNRPVRVIDRSRPEDRPMR